MPLERRSFLKKTAVVAAGVAALGCATGNQQVGDGGPAVQTQPHVNWRLASSFPRGLDTIYGVAETMAKRVSQLTAGRFNIRCYPAGELVPGLQVLDAVQQGTVHIGHSASYYYQGKNPALAFDCTMPFGLTARQQNAWLSHGGGLALMREVFADFNLLNFPCGNTGTQMGGWFRREIGSLSDLTRLKMRIPGLGGEVMNRLGVTVQVLAGGDIFPALERGTIDATEWVGPYDDEKLGFHKVAKYYYYPGWWEPGPNLSCYINRSAWEKLPPGYQAALEVAAAESNGIMLANYDAKNPAALERLLAQGVQMRPFSQDIMLAAEKVSFEIMHELAGKDAGYRKVFEAWQQFRTSSNRWFSYPEASFAAFSFKN